MIGAEALWPIIKGVAIVAVVLGLAAMIFRRVRKQGHAEAIVEVSEAMGERNEEAAEIMGESVGDADSWSARMRKKLSGDS